MRRWWLSWCQDGFDCRPLKWPPPAGVLAFWESGIGDDHCTVVALVEAGSEAKAKETITRAWSPGVGEWRFSNAYLDEGPPGDRFPAPDWSIELGRWPWKETP